MKAPCTLKDLLPIEQAQQVVDWFDSRPLTEETLKELNIQLEKPIGDYIEYYETNDGETSTLELNGIGGQRPKFKTVGKLKMIIEALKGDE